MGVRLNWLAVEEANKAPLLARLGLVEAGTASDEFSSALACAMFHGGWLVLASAGMEFDLDKALPLASTDGLALGCEIEEHVMFSRLRAFRNGALTWAVTHDPDRGDAVAGDPPLPFAELRTALAARQANEHEQVDHLFELPIRLGQALCGYTHDELHPVAWTILEPQGRTRAGSTAARPPRRAASELTSRLPKAFATVLEPGLQASGWTRGAEESGFRGGAWNFERVSEGRLQLLRLGWSDHGPAVDLEGIFVVFPGSDPEDAPLLQGETRAVRDASQDTGLQLRRRIAALFRPRAAEARPEMAAPAPTDPIEKLIARVKGDLAAIETLLTTGETSPRLRINHRSTDFLRPGGD